MQYSHVGSKLIEQVKKHLLRLSYYLQTEIEGKSQQIKVFGILFFINYPVYYFIWTYGAKQSYENLTLRISASIICIPLIFHNHWSIKLRRFQPIYWPIAVAYCLPFFFSYMTLRNDISIVWLLNLMLAIFLSLILLNLGSWLISMFLGFSAAYLAFFFTAGPTVFFNPGTLDFASGVATFIAAIAVGGIFLHFREKSEKEKLVLMRSFGDNIAHELRTPLAAINVSTTAIKDYLPDLLDAYKKAKENNLPIAHIRQSQLTALAESLYHIETEIKSANTFITMLLTKVTCSTKSELSDQNICSISDCVSEALERYPFQPSEKSLICWEGQNDFQFRGNEILVIHVLFNLIKNSLHYIASVDQGKITIRLAHNKKYNKLYFHDTGTGIAKEDLPQIFDRFYSKTTYGTGVGLAFCKMVMQFIDGDITVSSVEGKYTEFVLYFPKM